MFGIGGFELIIILLFAFLVLGPDKLPEVAKTAGKAIARFRDARKEMDDALREADLVDARTGKPPANPVDMIDKVAKAAADGKGSQIAEKMSTAAAAAASTIIRPQAEDPGVAAATSADGGERAEVDARPEGSGMSFAERKARYERGRAAREAAQRSQVADAAAEVDAPTQDAPAPAAPAQDTPAQDAPSAASPEGGDA